MKIKILGTNVTIEYSLIVTLIFMFFAKTLLLKYIIGMCCIIIHELSHIWTAKFFGLKLNSIGLYALGAKAIINDMSEVSRLKRILVYIMGPLTNLLIGSVFLYLKMWEYAYLNYILCFLNLIPVIPLDGGNILKEILESVKGYKDGVLYTYYISRLIVGILIILSVLQIYYQKNISLVIMTIYLCYLIKKEKKKIRIINILKEKIYY